MYKEYFFYLRVLNNKVYSLNLYETPRCYTIQKLSISQTQKCSKLYSHIKHFIYSLTVFLSNDNLIVV